MTQHTPGPWKYGPDNRKTMRVFSGSREIVRALSTHGNRRLNCVERAANARLISAAPDLLEALEDLLASDLVKWFPPWPPEGIVETGAPPWSEELKQRAAPILAARAAIAKARGV